MAESKQKQSAALIIERFGPILIGLLVLAALLYYRVSISLMFSNGGWQSAGLYTAIFDWSAIQTGFAFGVYGFVIGKADGFVAKIKGTKAMERFVSYIKRANVIGFFLTISSIPLIVINPEIKQDAIYSYYIVAIWFSIFVWSFMAFLRLAYNFGILASVKDKPFHGA